MRLLLPLVLLLATPVAGQTYSTDSGHVEFESSVPLHSFIGQSDALVGRIALADSTVDFYVDLETLDTGVGKRDKDMRKTLETDEYPFAEFFGKLQTPFDPAGQAQEVTVSGTFTVHGVARPLEVQGTITPTAGAVTLSAAWELNLDDFQIEPPKLLIMKVDPVQKIRIHATLVHEPGT